MICLTEFTHRGTRLENTDITLDLPPSRERIPLMRLPAPTSQLSLSKQLHFVTGSHGKGKQAKKSTLRLKPCFRTSLQYG